MKISEDIKLDFDDVLIKPKRSNICSRADVNIIRTFKPKYGLSFECLPIVAANMDTTGTFNMCKSLSKHQALCALHKHYTVEQLREFCANFTSDSFYAFFTIGQSLDDLQKLEEVFKDNFRNSRKICIDVANGYTEQFVECVKRARDRFPNNLIMVGNVCTPEMTEQLILSGADIVKIGIGPGSVCTTRIKTGIGFPQLSAILECKDAAHGLGGLVCADGGIKNAGDAAKAFGAGSDLIMLGGMLAGCDECDGEWEYDKVECSKKWIEKKVNITEARELGYDRLDLENLKFDENRLAVVRVEQEEVTYHNKTGLKFYGMSSKDAQEKYNGGLAKHRAAEGKTVTVPYKGKAEDVILDISGGVRSACAYTGAKVLKDFDKCCSFVRVSRTHQSIF